MMIYQRANKRGLSRDCRLSFAVCFSRRIKRFRGKASSSVDFSPFHLLNNHLSVCWSRRQKRTGGTRRCLVCLLTHKSRLWSKLEWKRFSLFLSSPEAFISSLLGVSVIHWTMFQESSSIIPCFVGWQNKKCKAILPSISCRDRFGLYIMYARTLGFRYVGLRSRSSINIRVRLVNMRFRTR